MKSPVTFWKPTPAGSHEAVSARATVVQGGRGDFEDAGVLLPGGSVVLTVLSALGVRKDWYVTVGGQQMRVIGVAPVPPSMRLTELECGRNTDRVDVLSVVGADGVAVTADGDEVATRSMRRVGA